MLYFGIEKARNGLTNGQTLSNQGAQSLWVLNLNQESRVAEKTGRYYDPNGLRRLGFLFFERKSFPSPLWEGIGEGQVICRPLPRPPHEGEGMKLEGVKEMRPPRIYKNETAYYISARASTNELLFREESDYLYFLEILKTRKQKYNFRLYGYCLLPGHYHLLIEPDQAESLSKIMQAINTSYSLYFNKKYNRSGHLLSGRFESKMFSKDTTLLEQSIHLHLNPIRLGLAKNLEDYKWSSYFEYVGLHDTNAQVVTDKECIFSFIRETLLVKSEEVSEKYREVANRRALEGAPVHQCTSHQSPVTSASATSASVQREPSTDNRMRQGAEDILHSLPLVGRDSLPAGKAGEGEGYIFSRKIRYQVLTAVMLVVLFILPQLITHQPKMIAPVNNFNKDFQVSLSQGLPFYNTLKTQAVTQSWEVWKLGPFGQGDTDGHN